MIELMKKEYASQVADLHIKGISTGFLSSLGPAFVKSLYEAIAESPHGFGLVQTEKGIVVGFVAFTTDLSKLYKSICLKKGFFFLILVFKKLFSWNTIKRLFQTLFYPKKSNTLKLPNAELLSIAVDESQRGKGIAPMLIQKGFEMCAERGISEIKVLVADFNQTANRLYQKTGFTFVTQIDSHGVKSNIYIIKL
jgi:ribosomal protein S18 acetylase RimI-like enzyme